MRRNTGASIERMKSLDQVRCLKGENSQMKVLSWEINSCIEVCHVLLDPAQFLFRWHKLTSMPSEMRSRWPCFWCERVHHLEVFVGVIVAPVSPGLCNGLGQLVFLGFPGFLVRGSFPGLNSNHFDPFAKELLKTT